MPNIAHAGSICQPSHAHIDMVRMRRSPSVKAHKPIDLGARTPKVSRLAAIGAASREDFT
jgi:hypothetical protein